MEILKAVFKALLKFFKRRGIYLGISYLMSMILIFVSGSILTEINYADTILGFVIGGLICLVLFFQGFVSFIDTVIYQVKTWDSN